MRDEITCTVVRRKRTRYLMLMLRTRMGKSVTGGGIRKECIVASVPASQNTVQKGAVTDDR